MYIGGDLPVGGFLVGRFKFIAVFAFGMSFCNSVFLGSESRSLMTQSAKTLYLCLVGMSRLI